jgi:hypothetical protein
MDGDFDGLTITNQIFKLLCYRSCKTSFLFGSFLELSALFCEYKCTETLPSLFKSFEF